MSDTPRFENRWRIEGTLHVLTPLHIGSGHETARADVMNDDTGEPAKVNAVATAHSGKPYIPASTLKGNLRAWLTRMLPNMRGQVERLFGSDDPGEKGATGSKLLLHDTFLESDFDPRPETIPHWDPQRQTGVAARVALDRATKTVCPQRLFHTEFVPAGVTFHVVIDGQNLSEDEVAVMLAGLEGFNHADDSIRIGGMTGHDWGRCKWMRGDVSRITASEVKAAVEKCQQQKLALPIGFGLCRPIDSNAIWGKALQLLGSVGPTRWLAIPVTLIFDGPFLVNDPSRCTYVENGDKHFPRLSPDGRGLLPAESVRGALRAQAERIVRTLNPREAPSSDLAFRAPNSPWPLIERMFGDAGWASAFRMTDATTESSVEPVRQEFVAVDRFTGGVSGSAKYNAKSITSPVFNSTLFVDVERLRKYAPGGLGLLALTLRDLCEGDVPFGFGTRKGYGGCRARIDFSGLAHELVEFRAVMQVPGRPIELPAIQAGDRLPDPKIVPLQVGRNEFHNPYHFVPVKKGARSNDLSVADFKARKFGHVTHDRYLDATFSGRLVCKLTTEGPCVFGSAQSRVNDVSVVENFRLDGVHAVPATSIKGLLSAVAEAASNSALRVLHGERSFSYRAEMTESLGAIGMIVLANDGTLKLAPLVLPQIELPREQQQRGRGNAAPLTKTRVPSQLAQIFRSHPSPVRVYLNGYQPNERDTKLSELIPQSFLEDASIHSHSHEHQEYWYLKLRGRVQFAGTELSFQDRSNVKIKRGRGNKPDYLLGQYAAEVDPRPIREAEWRNLPPQEQSLYRRGVLRILGIEGRERDMPMGVREDGEVVGKKHELFLPVPNGAPSTWFKLPEDIAPAVEAFYRLADERSENDGQNGRYPFELQGMARDANGRVRLRSGDLVCFHYEPQGNGGKLDRLAISSIWRKDAKTADHYFSALDKELLPFNPNRETITLAEQLFGFVELRKTRQNRGEREPGMEHGEGGNPVLALAGRLRIAAGRLPDGTNVQPMSNVILKVLASPKPPSPSLYFAGRVKDGTHIPTGHMLKKEFADHANGVPRPQGRKFYIHDKPGKAPRHETQFPNDLRNQKNSVRPLPKDTTFYLHIDFDNLSETELALLCYSIRPTEKFRHKLGMGKPLGLGKVRLDPVGLFLVNRNKRYGHDNLTAARYHAGWVAQHEQTSTWPGRYDLEKTAPTGSGPSPLDLRELFRSEMDGDIRHALELIGDPASTTADVMYPQILRPQKGDENECYRWWVANDDTRNPGPDARQALDPISPQTQSLPTLRRQ